MATTTCNWLAQEFTVYTPNINWNAVAGVYIFAGLTPQNQWRAYYIGQAYSFQARIPSHERWFEAARLGATHVHAMAVSQPAIRDSIERALIQAYQPPLNTELE